MEKEGLPLAMTLDGGIVVDIETAKQISKLKGEWRIHWRPDTSLPEERQYAVAYEA